MIQEQTMRSQNRPKMAETTIQILQSSLDDNNNIPLTVAMVADNNQNDSTNSTVSNASSLPSATKTIIQLPDNILESLNRLNHFPTNRYRWNTNEEIAAMLISIDQHEKWLSQEVQLRPKSGSMLLYSRKHVHYRRDGYCWKKRKDGKTTREDHMKLKVQGIECIYGCYVHSAILPTFHRRCYWLLQNPNIVLVHYLNVPYNDDNKIITRTLNSLPDTKKEWTREDLLIELKPMFFSVINENENNNNNNDKNNNNNNSNECSEELERSTLETIETIVQQLLLKQLERFKTTLSTLTSSTGEDLQANEISATTNTTTKNNHNPNSLNGNSNDLVTGRAMTVLSDNLNANVNSSKAHQIFTSLSSGQIVEASVAQAANTTRLKRDATTITASIANQTAASNVVEDAVDINGNSLILQQPHTQQQNTVHGLLLGGGNVSGDGNCFTFETPTSQNLQQQTSPTSLILNMSQIQPSFIILNNDNSNSNTNNNNSIDDNDSGRRARTPTNQVIGSGGVGRTMTISDQNTVSSILSFVTYRQQQQSNCLSAKLSSSSRTNTPTSSSSSSAASASSLSPLSSCSSLSNNSGIAFKVPINVGINTDPFSAFASSVSPPTSSTILSSFSGTTMACGTKTKNSVMTPILTPMACSMTIRSPKNKKNDGLIEEEEEIAHAHRHNLMTATVLADEIEMDTLNDLDGVGTNDSGANFNLDDEESMLICSNASTPERTIINNQQHKHHNLNNMINNSLHGHHHHHHHDYGNGGGDDASFDAFDSLYDDHGAGLVTNHQRHQRNDSRVSVVDHHTFDTGQAIDFMDHEDIPTSDDILFNLETFDMFTEFDQLDSQPQHEETTTTTNHDVGLEVVNQLNTNKTEMPDNNQDQQDNDNHHHHNNGSGTNNIRPLLCGAFETTTNMIAQPESGCKDKIDGSNKAQDVAADDDDDQENIPISVQEFWNNQTTVQTRSEKDSSETKTVVHDTAEAIISGHPKTELVPQQQQQSESHTTTSSIDVTVDENGNLSITKTLRPAGAPSRTSGGQGATIPNVSTMSQNHPLLKRQLSAASLLMIGNGYSNHNDDNNNNNSGSSGHDHHQQQEQQQKNLAPSSIECRRLYYSSSSSSSSNTAAAVAVADVNHKGGLDNNGNLPQATQKINITDYSPEWCYTEGGIKVLVAGPWCDHSLVGDSNHYSILFDNIPVPTELVQNGLLRCFSPKHGPGLVKLDVSCNDIIISNSVIFEYRLFSGSSFNHHHQNLHHQHHNAISSNCLTHTNAYLNLPSTNQNSLYFNQSKKINGTNNTNTNNLKSSLDHIKAESEQEEEEEERNRN